MGEIFFNIMIFKKKPHRIYFDLNTTDMKSQRYESIDDWFDPWVIDKDAYFRTLVADTGNIDYNFLVLLHAMIEQYLCYRHGVSDEKVTKWDLDNPELDDPGSHHDAPYHSEHMAAENIERAMAYFLKVDWKKYEKEIYKTLSRYDK